MAVAAGRRRRAAHVAAGLALLSGFGLALPAASAADPAPVTISITGTGQVPEATDVPAGAAVVFLNATSRTLLVSGVAVDGQGRGFDAGSIEPSGSASVVPLGSLVYSIRLPPVHAGAEAARTGGGRLVLEPAAPASPGPAAAPTVPTTGRPQHPPPSHRRYGLPVTVALVLCAGVGSMLVRVFRATRLPAPTIPPGGSR